MFKFFIDLKKNKLKLCNVYFILSDFLLYVCKFYRFGDFGV